ncbi:MAG: hypothetical protein IPG01_16675 [Chitinophagaceae bacterium]|nr:hypothetical protein [Chitinophagaceae bacterium]
MEKNSLVILLLLLVIPLTMQAQGRKKPFIQKDMFSCSAGLSGGILVSHPIQDIYINTSVEYFMERRISVKFDAFFFLPDYNFEGQLQKNSSILVGAGYHFPYQRWDTYITFQPGLAFPGLSLGNTALEVKTGVEPILSATGGVSYYFFNNLHAFASIGYVHGNYFPEETETFHLDEVRIAAGIGFNVFFNRYAPYERRRPHF